MKAITHAQQRVIEVIHRRLEAGAAPTLRELADELRMSRTGAREHLHALARKGIVRLRPGAHRGIRWRVRPLARCSKGERGDVILVPRDALVWP